MDKKMTKAIQHLQSINIQDEYGTPIEVYCKGISISGIKPILDVCTNKENRKCLTYFTKEDNALNKEWDLDFWMNPPYSMVKQFMRYAYEQCHKHNVNGLILTYSKTDTQWWHRYVEGKAQVYFIQGRIKFLNEQGQLTRHPAPYPSCFIVYRNKI